MIKKALNLIFIGTSFCTNILIGQIGVGPIENVKTSPGEFQEANLKALKDSKTMFVCKDTDNKKLFEQELKKVWTFSQLEVISYSSFKALQDKNSSYFTIESSSLKSRSSSTANTLFVYINLWMNISNQKGKLKKKSFARMELHRSDYTFNYKNKDPLKVFYEKDIIRNWSIGIIKTYVGIINDILKNNNERWLYENTNEQELKKLKTNTLYIPKYTIQLYDVRGKLRGEQKIKSLLKDYNYKFKIVSNDGLNDLIVNSTIPTYFLVYVRNSSNKYLTIYRNQEPKILYSEYSPMSYKIKSSDFKKLNNEIKKSTNK